MPPEVHSVLGASAADRWMNCTPSAQLTAGMEDETTTFAAEGTAAHALCEWKVRKALKMRAGRRPTSDYWTDEMEEFTDDYRDFIMDLVGQAKLTCKDPVTLIEQHLDFSCYVPDGFGTGDFLLVADKELNVVDFKYGRGVAVYADHKGEKEYTILPKAKKRTSHSNPADCYECSTYNLAYQKYDRHCTCHHISTKALKSIILKTIQETCHYVSLNEREFVYSLQEESAMKDIAVSETVKNRIERNQKRVHELDMLIRKIYEDNVIGRLPDRLFQSMLTDYENEQNELNKIIETDTADMQRIIGGQNNVERFLKLVKKYENITELTPAMINEFIDKILVHEPQGKGADRTTEVEIYLNYVGQFQVPVEQHEPTEEERIAAEKEAERLRRKRESNRKYMKKIREKSKEFAEHERIAEEKSSDSNVCVEQNATSKSNRQKVKGEKIA